MRRMATSYITPETFRFLSDLARHNDREWFSAEMDPYIAEVRDPLLRFVEAFAGPSRRSAPTWWPIRGRLADRSSASIATRASAAALPRACRLVGPEGLGPDVADSGVRDDRVGPLRDTQLEAAPLDRREPQVSGRREDAHALGHSDLRDLHCRPSTSTPRGPAGTRARAQLLPVRVRVVWGPGDIRSRPASRRTRTRSACSAPARTRRPSPVVSSPPPR